MNGLRLVGVGLLGLVALPAVAAPSPSSYMPADATLVLSIPSPAQTLKRAEKLAAQAGLAPPGAAAGWLEQTLHEQVPPTASIDMSKPLAFGIAPKAGSKVADIDAKDFRAVLVLGVKGKGDGLAELIPDGKSRIEKGWMISTIGEGLGKPLKASFQSPKSASTLEKRSDVTLHVDMKRMKLPDADAKTAALQDALAVGLGLGATGLDIFTQSFPDPKGPMAKMNRSLKPTSDPIITGLPAMAYAAVFGTVGSPNATDTSLVDQYGSLLGPMLDEISPKLAPLLLKVAKTGLETGSCERSSFAVLLPGALEKLELLGAATGCEKAAAKVAATTDSVKELNELVQIAEEYMEDPIPLRFAKVAKPTKAGGTTFSGLQIVPASKKTAADAKALFSDFPMLEQPLLLGTAGKKSLAYAWNAPSAQLGALVKSAAKGGPTPTGDFAVAKKQLVSPRSAEGYVQLGSLATPFLTEELAPLSMLLKTLPPLAFASRTFDDGSNLAQIWVPSQLAQLGIMGAQLAAAASQK